MPFSRRTLLAAALLLVASSAGADDLTTTAGKKISGKLVGIDAQGVTFLSGDTRVTVPGKDIVLIDLGHKVAPIPKAKDGKLERTAEIELTDGSTFRVGRFLIKGRKVETELLPGPEGVTAPALDIPLGAVFSVMRGAEEPKNREPWKKVLGSRGKRDMYVTRGPAGLDFVQGTILGGNDAGTELTFEKEDGTKDTLLLSRATGGLVFSQPAPAQVPPMICKVNDVFGNVLAAQSVQLAGEAVTVTTVAGVAVRYPYANAIARIDYAGGNVAYLSDLVPAVDAPAVPPDERGLRLNPAPAFTRDVGLSGEPLKLGNDVFPKGLVVAPEVVLTYNIGGDYRDFRAVVGLPENSPDGDLGAKVTIEADGKPVFSEALRRKDRPKPVVLDVKGVKQLRVIVEADLPVNGNRVVFGDARVQK